MIKIFISILISINLFCLTFAQDNGRWGCEDNCGSGTLQEYWNGEVDCVCSLDCAGYGDACCNFYDECFENPSNLEFSDFIGTWNGNITNDQTWSYDDLISIDIESNGAYTVTNNPGGHLVSGSYPGTEEVYYGTNGYGVNVLQFQWVSYYHYACGGACYSGVTFQVMEYGDGEMILFYNNGSGPAPQANSMFLTLENECTDGEINNDNPCMPMECYNGQWYEMIIDCAEQMGVPCDGGVYVAPPDEVCCSTCVQYGDNNGDGILNVLDVVAMVNLALSSEYEEIVDMNGDGTINVLDIVLLVGIILG